MRSDCPNTAELASRLDLIDEGVQRALHALRKLRNAFAHSAESASLADPTHSDRLAPIYAEVRVNPLWAPLETFWPHSHRQPMDRWSQPYAITSY